MEFFCFYRNMNSLKLLMEEGERKALLSSNGVRWEEADCFQNVAEARAQQKEGDRRVAQLQKDYGTINEIQKELAAVTERHRVLGML